VNYRNKKLRDTACAASCVMCGADDGTIVWAHANMGEFGKGGAIKASDAAGGHACFRCHSELDQGNKMTREEKRQFTFEMIARTYIRLMEEGKLVMK
jgi:hypothetical protein